MRPDQERFARGLWLEGLVAALATLSVAWPLTNLLREDTWVVPAVLMVALVALSGAVLRTLDVPPTAVALGQLFLGLAALAGTYLRETLWRGVVPTRDTLELMGSLLAQAGSVLQTYAAPAPTTQGVSFLVVAVLTLTAVSVDSMGVTGRAPASAGIPLAAGFLVSVSNTGSAMAPWYFVVVAAMWLLMIVQQGRRMTTAWPSANRQESRGGSDVSQGPRTHRGLAQVAGVLALVASVLGAAALPHLPPTFFGDGLARNQDARTPGSDAGDVAFTETMDPAQDLRNQSRAPVLSYRVRSGALQPLRVTATQRFEDGRWEAPERRSGDLLPDDAPLPDPPGLREDVPVTSAEFEVLGNELEPPHLATPTPVTELRLGGTGYRFDPGDSTVVLEGAVESYQADYLNLASGGELPAGIGDAAADAGAFEEDLLALDPVSQDAVASLTDEVVGDEQNALLAAVLIQDHLRTDGGYSYSLELEPAAEAGTDDPIGGFLETQQGYCVQFATAMVMMARHEGIPARMAVGFLPGTTQPDGTRQVVASDAHTWPELWIDGLGWTRFEPTPGLRAGSPPSYALSTEPADDVTPSTAPVPEEITPTPEPAPEPDPADRSWTDDVRDLLPALGRALLALLALAVLLTLLPLLGRRHREAGVRSADGPRARIEGQWLLLTRSLEDLGVTAPPPRSPRLMHRHYLAGSTLGTPGEEALERVTATLERSRYAAPSDLSEAEADRMGEDVRTVVDAVRHTCPWNVRANAALIPRSGLEGLREGTRNLFRR
ncbi:transglutaminaseTgpA domain-containing protein [Serinicoccus sp. LYQ131]|uniref:transglutaminase family protein n=1 Tax=Serinicoccus sp. LYQ131 TaxID=3378797 RepID=UPI00385200BE